MLLRESLCSLEGRACADANLVPDHSAVLAALYLRGLSSEPLLSRRAWPLVLGALRREAACLERSEFCLRRAGFRAEALALGHSGALARAEHLVTRGRVLTACSDNFPIRWTRVLGAAAPPALWIRGRMLPGPFITVVGSRRVSKRVWRFAQSLAAEATSLGYAVASGGAEGCDSAAAFGAIRAMSEPMATDESFPPLVEIWPCGLGAKRTRRPGCALSVCKPFETFNVAAAMERNLMLYAMSDLAAVCQARFKEGGTWNGAAEALRRRVCRLAVRWDPNDRAARALKALGAFPLGSPSDLQSAIESPAHQPGLYGAG